MLISVTNIVVALQFVQRKLLLLFSTSRWFAKVSSFFLFATQLARSKSLPSYGSNFLRFIKHAAPRNCESEKMFLGTHYALSRCVRAFVVGKVA